MGLDLYHCVPAPKDEIADECPLYFSLDELSGNQGYIEKHQSLITEIAESDVTEDKILLFKDAAIKDIYCQSHDCSNQLVLLGWFTELENEIVAFEKENKLDCSRRYFMQSREGMLSQKYGKEISYTSISYTFPVLKKVIFFQQVGYQRKGMNPKFYEDFGNRNLYLHKADVIKASCYLNTASTNHAEELTTHFKANFIDNFVEDESIFFGDW
ncbi:MAG: hypothetical protein MUD08_13270 [Cytophagales bacterium]|nr:hypothetical protein [Cytophagales bacterium]